MADTGLWTVVLRSSSIYWTLDGSFEIQWLILGLWTVVLILVADTGTPDGRTEN